MQNQFKTTSFILLFSCAAFAKNSPSFDCRKASTAVEKSICSDGYLSEQDASLGKEFKHAKDAIASNTKLTADLKSSQVEWASNRKFCIVYAAHGETESCLQGAYKQRLAFLTGITGGTTSLTGDQAQPLSCSFFGSWQTHWDKSSPEDAKKLYGFLAADFDNCWKQLEAKPEARSYYARNYMQVVTEAGTGCKEAGQHFDDFALAQEKLWSLSTDYLNYRLTCHLDSDAQLVDTITKRADSLRANAEELYQKLKTALLNSPQWADINNAHVNLESVFKTGTPLQKLVEADIEKHTWTDSLKVTNALPHECGGQDACVKLQVGSTKQLVTIQVHFKPSNDDQADITAVEMLDAAGKVHPLPLPEDTSCSQIDNKWAVSSEDCESNGIRYLAIGHSTAKFPYWDALSVDVKNAKLVKKKNDCTSMLQN